MLRLIYLWPVADSKFFCNGTKKIWRSLIVNSHKLFIFQSVGGHLGTTVSDSEHHRVSWSMSLSKSSSLIQEESG